MKRAVATHRANRNGPAAIATLPENDRYISETNLQVTCTSHVISFCFPLKFF